MLGFWFFSPPLSLSLLLLLSLLFASSFSALKGKYVSLEQCENFILLFFLAVVENHGPEAGIFNSFLVLTANYEGGGFKYECMYKWENGDWSQQEGLVTIVHINADIDTPRPGPRSIMEIQTQIGNPRRTDCILFSFLFIEWFAS